MPSAGSKALTAAGNGRRLKPLSGNVCLRPDLPHHLRAFGLDVSNPSRGTCAFGPRCMTFHRFSLMSLKPLSGNVCLRPRLTRYFAWRVRFVSNPSRGTCAFGHVSIAWPSAWLERLKPLSGNVCLRPYPGGAQGHKGFKSQTPLGERVPSAGGAQGHKGFNGPVSNPSRGTCAFGRVHGVRRTPCTGSLKPLSGNVCLRPNVASPYVEPISESQTPLGERVPSAWLVSGCASPYVESSLKPLSGNVCLRPRYRFMRNYALRSLSQTPLGERVPSALGGSPAPPSCLLGLKPLSGNVCLRPFLPIASNNEEMQSQTPLGERVPSAS